MLKLKLWEGSMRTWGTIKLTEVVYLWRQRTILGVEWGPVCFFLMVFPPFLLLTTMEAGYVARGASVLSQCGCPCALTQQLQSHIPNAIAKASSVLGPAWPNLLSESASIDPQKGSGSLRWKCRFSCQNLKWAVCCLLFQGPASPPDGLRHHAPLAGLWSWTGRPCPAQRDSGGPSPFPRACRAHADLPRGAVCGAVQLHRDHFGSAVPWLQRVCCPPMDLPGAAWARAPGWRRWHLVEPTAPSSMSFPFRLSLVPLAGWGLGSHSTDCINVAEQQQGFPKAAPSVQGTCSSGLPWSCCALLEFVPNPIPAV